MCKFNFEQQGFKVLLLKSLIDTRDVKDNNIIVHSRIGLESPCIGFSSDDNLIDIFKAECQKEKYDIIIVDECQFATAKQIEQLKQISLTNIVMCYGLLTNFQTYLFIYNFTMYNVQFAFRFARTHFLTPLYIRYATIATTITMAAMPMMWE